jgi:hypothetical protein
MDACDVDRAVILGIYPRVSNAFIAEQARIHPERFIHFVSVNPNDGQAAVDLFKQCLQAFHPKGLKIHPSMQHFEADDIALLSPLMRAVETASIPVLLHSWAWFGQDSEAAPRRIMTLAQAFPAVTFIMAHCGGMGFLDLLPMARLRKRGELDNLFVDVSAIIDDLADSSMWPMLEWVLKAIGLDRVLMGSDFPDYSVKNTLGLVRTLELDEHDMALVSGHNAQQLFGV